MRESPHLAATRLRRSNGAEALWTWRSGIHRRARRRWNSRSPLVLVSSRSAPVALVVWLSTYVHTNIHTYIHTYIRIYPGSAREPTSPEANLTIAYPSMRDNSSPTSSRISSIRGGQGDIRSALTQACIRDPAARQMNLPIRRPL